MAGEKIMIARQDTLEAVQQDTQGVLDKIGTAADTGGSATAGTVMGKLNQVLENLDTKVSSSDSDIFFVIDFLLSNEDEKIEFAFEQTCIGDALNQIGNFNSDALSACHSVNEIAANSELIAMIGGNEQVVSICALKPILREKLSSYLSAEDALAYGYGYSRYAAGDIVTLKYYGKDRKFRVIAKDHYTTGKLLLFPEAILETYVWDAGTNNYGASLIRGYLNDYVLSGFSKKIQVSLATPAIQCHNKNTAITCHDKIWLLSTVELGQAKGTTNTPAEGKAIAWFNSNTRCGRKMNGVTIDYWTRTPHTGFSNYTWCVNTDGGFTNSAVRGDNGVAFALEI